MEGDQAFYLEQPWLPLSESSKGLDTALTDLVILEEIKFAKYQRAIKQVVRQGDVVLDLCTGTGLLSQWALEEGAARVYGIDADASILSLAVDRMNNSGYRGRFVPINRSSLDVVLPEKVDVVMSEFIGNLGDNEGFHLLLKDAHERLVKAGGRSVPQSVTTYLVPVQAERAHARVARKQIEALGRDCDIHDFLRKRNIRSVFNHYYDTIISEASYLSSPQPVRKYSDTWRQSAIYSVNRDYTIDVDGLFTGFKGYFVADLSRDERIDISGENIIRRKNSVGWKHAYLPIETPMEVKAGDQLSLLYNRNQPRYGCAVTQVYRWQGNVLRQGQVVGTFDQCLDENELLA